MRGALVGGMLCLALACAGEPGPPDATSVGNGAAGGALAGGSGGSAASAAGGGGKAGSNGGYGGADEGGVDPFPPVTLAPGWEVSFAEQPPAISCATGLDAAKTAGAPSLTFGAKTLVAGYEQSGQNQNPVVALFDGATQIWCERHEQEAPDGRAYGLSWDGGAWLYVVYTVVGGGTALDDAAKNGWLASYGSGGGPKVTFVGKVDAGSGALQAGSYVIAKKQDGSTNTLTPLAAVLPLESGSLEVRGSSAFQPLNPDKSTMTCSAYPFYARYVLSADFSQLMCASATNCQASTPCP